MDFQVLRLGRTSAEPQKLPTKGGRVPYNYILHEHFHSLLHYFPKQIFVSIFEERGERRGEKSAGRKRGEKCGVKSALKFRFTQGCLAKLALRRASSGAGAVAEGEPPNLGSFDETAAGTPQQKSEPTSRKTTIDSDYMVQRWYKPGSVLRRNGASTIYLQCRSLDTSSNLPPDIGRVTLNCRYTRSCNP